MSGTPGGASVPTDFFASMNMQYGTANLVVQKPDGAIRPYGLVGLGVYYRPVKVTTPSVGFVPGYCDPWWYVCFPGGFVPVENIVGERSSTDFGMDFGGGVNFGVIYAEVRYHYIWGPTVAVTGPIQPLPGVSANERPTVSSWPPPSASASRERHSSLPRILLPRGGDAPPVRTGMAPSQATRTGGGSHWLTSIRSRAVPGGRRRHCRGGAACWPGSRQSHPCGTREAPQKSASGQV